MGYTKQVKKDAKAAADYIRKHGWVRHRFLDYRGRVCMVGAVRSVCSGSPGVSTANSDRMENALRRIIKEQNLIDWNDTPGRTKDEVLEVFDRIANS